MEGRMQPTVAPPLDPAELGEALREFGQSRMLPRVAYTSERVLAFELERLFAGSWVCVARAEDLPDPGDRLAVQVCDVGVLVGLPLEVWHGFVMVNASGDAAPLGQHLGALDELVTAYRPERLVAMASHEYLPSANWKVLCENYHECYHCPRIHPELCRVSPPGSGRNYDLPGAWVGGSMDLREQAATMSLDGRSAGVPIQGLDPSRLRTVEYLHLLPNLLLSLHPDYLMTHLIEPLGPARSRVVCTWYFPPEAAELPGFDPAYAVEFWDRTNRQDWAACESVQRGMANPHFRPGPLAPGEDAVYRFETLIARAYLGEYPG